MKHLLRLALALFVFTTPMNTLFADTQQKSKVEVLLFIQQHDNSNEFRIYLKKISTDKWEPYVGSTFFGAHQQGMYHLGSIPYGTFLISVLTDHCKDNQVPGNFTVGEGVKKVEIFYDAKECRFISYGFSTS